MILYRPSKRFDLKTGDELEPGLERTGYICDYSGQILTNRDENKPFFEIDLKDIGGCEEFWYYDEHSIVVLIQKETNLGDYEIRSTINRPPYHFASGYNNYDESVNLIREWYESMASHQGLLKQCKNIVEVFSLSRYRMLEKLLKEKKITLIEIGFRNI